MVACRDSLLQRLAKYEREVLESRCMVAGTDLLLALQGEDCIGEITCDPLHLIGKVLMRNLTVLRVNMGLPQCTKTAC